MHFECFTVFLYIICFQSSFYGLAYTQSDLNGHLLPLGQQHPPSIDIDEFTPETAPSPKEFYKKYVKTSKAAIFRNAMLETRAFKLWTDDYLKSNYGDLEVRIEGKKEKIHAVPVGEEYMGRDTIKHFVDNYHSPNSTTYIVSELPKQMYGDAGVLPSLGACGDMVNSFVEIDLWWSGGNSKSVIHKDAFNQINCLLRGSKHWQLFENKYEKWLYKHFEGEGETGGFSDINIDAVDLKKHPDFLKVPWSNFTVNAGDCIFLPKSYYHQVNSDGPFNLAFSILFSRFDYVTPKNFSDCTAQTDYIVPRPLSDFNVMWQWKGKGLMSMGFGDFEENYRIPLLEELEVLEKKGKAMDEKQLASMFDAVILDGQVAEGNFTGAVDCLDSNKDGKLSRSEIKSATFDQFVTFGEMVEYYEPSNTYTFEYSFHTYSDVRRFLKKHLKRNEKLTRGEWLRLYRNDLKGSKRCAEEVFNGLTQSDVADVITSKDVTDQDIERALANWKYYTAVATGSRSSNLKDESSDDDDGGSDDDGGNDDDDSGDGDNDDNDDNKRSFDASSSKSSMEKKVEL